jgi:hypothetical protein
MADYRRLVVALRCPAETGDRAVHTRLLTRSIARHLERFAERKVGAFTLHDLRRTVRTGLAKLGIRPDIRRALPEPPQPGIIATYDTRQYVEEKRATLTQWIAHLEKLRAGKSTNQTAAARLSGNQLEMTHECSTKFCNSRCAAFREPGISILDIVPQTIKRDLTDLSARADHRSAQSCFQVLLQ